MKLGRIKSIILEHTGNVGDGWKLDKVYTEKKVEPKLLHPGAVLENGATSEGGAVFSLRNHV